MRYESRNAKIKNASFLCFHDTALMLLSDIDECSNGAHNCHSNAGCVNMIGSFNCSCNKGYSGDGVVCLGLSLNFIQNFRFKKNQLIID